MCERGLHCRGQTVVCVSKVQVYSKKNIESILNLTRYFNSCTASNHPEGEWGTTVSIENFIVCGNTY